MLHKPFRPWVPDEDSEILVLSAMDHRIVPRLITRERMIIGLIVALALFIGAYAYVRFGLTSTVAVDAERLSIATVTRGVFHDYIPLTGNVVPRTTVYLTTEQGGTVKQVLAEDGALVKKGQSLIVLSNPALQLQVAAQQLSFEQTRFQNQKDLLDIQNQLDKLTASLGRDKILVTGGALAASIYQGDQQEYAYYQKLQAATVAAHATAEKVRATQLNGEAPDSNADITQAGVEALTIRAPMDGLLTNLDAEIGQSKAVGSVLGQVNSADQFKLTAQVDEFYLARVATGQRATAEIDGRTYALTVAKIYPGVKDRQFVVDLTFKTQPPAIRTGQSLNLKLEVGEAGHSVIVANGAFRDDSAGQFVFALSPDGGTATRRPVTLGRFNPDAVEVLSGLKSGDRIITSTYAPYLKFDRIDIHGSTSGGVSQP